MVRERRRVEDFFFFPLDNLDFLHWSPFQSGLSDLRLGQCSWGCHRCSLQQPCASKQATNLVSDPLYFFEISANLSRFADEDVTWCSSELHRPRHRCRGCGHTDCRDQSALARTCHAAHTQELIVRPRYPASRIVSERHGTQNRRGPTHFIAEHCGCRQFSRLIQHSFTLVSLVGRPLFSL